ncbi:MAG TPA: DUF6599 family protein [Bryobacteraceae bacterium]|jgi:hypothetical protein|nr:DUF6599 family protein [Bryobacteraceae bacterium]HXJ39063.1 DUF6599 family protein [Bryobacteraceae bacterium]
MKYLVAFLLPAFAFAGIWPDTFGAFHRTVVQPVEVSDRPLWDEYGFQQAEQAQYESGVQKFTATAYRLQDSTGALAAFEWQRPADAKSSPVAKLAVETSGSLMVAHGNYVLLFNGYKPNVGEIDALYQTLPSLDQSSLPVLIGYLPKDQLVANSERYVTGPVALQKFYSGIPPSTAAFHLGAEAQLARFRARGGELGLAIFSYPTPQIARERLVDFQRISGVMAKRAGPLVAVILSPGSADDAERLLAKVRYEPAITWNERVPTARDNIGNLVINAFELIGILLAFFVVAGLAYGGIRAFLRRGGPGGEADRMITLHLSDQ